MRKPSMGFRPDLTQTSLYSHKSRLEASNFGFKKKMGFTICAAKIYMRPVKVYMVIGFYVLLNIMSNKLK